MARRRLSIIAAALLVTACRSDADRTRAASATKSPGSDTGASSASHVEWFPGEEPMLLLPAHSNDRSLVALADSTAEEPGEGLVGPGATLVRLDGTKSPARVTIGEGTEGCIEAALDPAPSTPWGVGFVGTSPTPLAADSLHGMSIQDSSALSRVVFRLASMVPNAPGGRFAGLPFGLVDLWRIRLPDGSIALVATTRRQLNQEDSPLEERTLIIAESDSGTNADFSLKYSERSTGAEETVESRDLLAAVSFPASASVELVVAHDYGDETSYSIVERASRGRWVMRWSSRRFSC